MLQQARELGPLVQAASATNEVEEEDETTELADDTLEAEDALLVADDTLEAEDALLVVVNVLLEVA